MSANGWCPAVNLHHAIAAFRNGCASTSTTRERFTCWRRRQGPKPHVRLNVHSIDRDRDRLKLAYLSRLLRRAERRRQEQDPNDDRFHVAALQRDRCRLRS
jgi:hypothetical protein